LSLESDDELEFDIETVPIPEPVEKQPPIPFIQDEIKKRELMDSEMFQLRRKKIKNLGKVFRLTLI
jgi:hypothetical protein